MTETQTVEVEVIVRVRDERGVIVGAGARIEWSTEPKHAPLRKGSSYHGTIMHLHQRRMIAEGIKGMAKDFVEGHFRGCGLRTEARDTQSKGPFTLRVVNKIDGAVLGTSRWGVIPKDGAEIVACMQWWVVCGYFDTVESHGAGTLLVRARQ